MKKTTETQFNTLNLVERLIEADKAYEGSGHPLMTDKEYDSLRALLKEKSPDHPYFEKVGHPASSSWKKINHSIFMGSLEKVHAKDELLKWASKFESDTIFVLQHKMDGLSISLDYENLKLVRAITRGDGTTGENIIANVCVMGGIVLETPSFTGSVRAEIILPKERFKEINSVLAEKEKYSNPRNAASGISRRLDGIYAKYLEIIAYDITESLNEDEKIPRLEELGFNSPFFYTGKIEDIVDAFEKVKELRNQYPYDIDGVVVKVCSQMIQKEMGMSGNRPKAQKAWKFEPPQAATILKNVTWEVGRTGVVTPLAHLEPVEVDGSIISKATLHNVAQIKKLQIGLDDVVMLVKAGDIIPKIISVPTHMGTPVEIPTHCPSCNSELINDEITLICSNDDCPKKIVNRILNWVKVTKIDEFGESLVLKLHELGKLNKIFDIYLLQEEDISEIGGWGKLSAEKIMESINKTYVLSPIVFLSALGIPGISHMTSKELISAFGSLETLLEKSVNDIKVLKGFSDISAKNVVKGLSKHIPEIEELLKVITIEENILKKGILDGKSFCFTGDMDKPRSYYQDLVKTHGGEVKSSVVKTLSYLVCNEDKGSAKSQKAEKYGIKTIDEKTFLSMAGVSEIQSKPEPVTRSRRVKKKTYSTYSMFDED